MVDDGLEGRLLPLWRSVLNRPDLTGDADFFENGGDSLLATQLVAILRMELGRPTLSVRTVFNAPSAAEYAVLLARL
ncbi:MAG: hypothetical protein AUG49_11765 [Catenulispora sp. 13_1_20CM_3_70_7]|jgi:hypothetical protein|uniref:phosphopantetheine-binding protein n=1 Tax=Streptomyces sp. TaxID=1931 RepID=UPI000961C3CA|nr:phosphopantetheine-binding protein [Streptomyces sp.]MBW8799877.1 hypothetical protein [Streptomyces sp.]OLE25058.1 MAG: hypothetical protein AUG49_11765 [Catenulispora sp. 13_1_20CM_3_70_7]